MAHIRTAPPNPSPSPSSFSPSLLLSLPSELLHPVLHHIFHLHHAATYSILVWLSSTSTVKQVANTDALAPANFPGFMLTCRRLHREGWGVLLEGGVLGISLFTDCDEPGLGKLVEWFVAMGVGWLVRRCRVVRVVGGWPRCDWGSVGQMVGLRRVVIRTGVVVRFVVKEEDDGDHGGGRVAVVAAAEQRLRDVLEGRWPVNARDADDGDQHAMFEKWAQRVPCAGKGVRDWPFVIEQGMRALVSYRGRDLLMACIIDLRNFHVLTRRYLVGKASLESPSGPLLHSDASSMSTLVTTEDAVQYFMAAESGVSTSPTGLEPAAACTNNDTRAIDESPVI